MFEAPCTAISLHETLSIRNTPIAAYGLQSGSLGLIELTIEDAIIMCEVESEGKAPVSFLKMTTLKN